jgi:hypothetical protein
MSFVDKKIDELRRKKRERGEKEADNLSVASSLGTDYNLLAFFLLVPFLVLCGVEEEEEEEGTME